MRLLDFQPTAVPALLYLGWLPLYWLAPARWGPAFFITSGLGTLCVLTWPLSPLLAAALPAGIVAGWFVAEGVARSGRARPYVFLLVLAALHAAFWACFKIPLPPPFDALPAGMGPAVFMVFSGVGLTFFRLVSYLWDRGQRARPPLPLGHYLAYMFYAPQFRHGPLERAHEFVPRLHVARAGWRLRHVGRGLLRIAAGFATLLPFAVAGLIMGRYGVQFDFFDLLRRPEQLDLPQLLLLMHGPAVALYLVESSAASLQLGVSRAYNVVGTENYDRPFLAVEPREVWRRWNITLSTWLRDYCYLPLGGRERRTLAIVVTFVYCGLLHGLQWRCLAWGVYTGVTLAAYMGIRQWIQNVRERRPGRSPAATPASGHASARGNAFLPFVGRWAGRLLTFHWFAIGVTVLIDGENCGVRVLRQYVRLLWMGVAGCFGG